ncbi:MAG: lyase family protein, partial [Patescibacteria group bacterium]|nr:lyase family protein [Patescibacteria group bacterium]
LQKGSSIMPGKVNPVVSELVNQWHFLVSGNNLMIEKSAEAGQLELNTMFPLLADKLLESLKLSDEVVGIFGLKCVRKIKADKKRCLEHLENSTALSVKFISLLGYKKVEEIVKKSISSGKSFKELIIKSGVSEKEWRKRV